MRKRPIYDDYVYDPACQHQQSTCLEETVEAPVHFPLNPTISESNNVLRNIDHRLNNTPRTYSSNPSLRGAKYAAIRTSTEEAEDVILKSYFDDVGREEEICYQASSALLDP